MLKKFAVQLVCLLFVMTGFSFSITFDRAQPQQKGKILSFSIYDARATNVNLYVYHIKGKSRKRYGTFPLKHVSGRQWKAELTSVPDGRYSYYFRINGHKISDPLNLIPDYRDAYNGKNGFTIKKGKLYYDKDNVDARITHSFHIIQTNGVVFYLDKQIPIEKLTNELASDLLKIRKYKKVISKIFGVNWNDIYWKYKIVKFKDKDAQKQMMGRKNNCTFSSLGQVYFGRHLTTPHEFMRVFDVLYFKQGKRTESLCINTGFAYYFSHYYLFEDDLYSNRMYRDWVYLEKTAIMNHEIFPVDVMIDNRKFHNTIEVGFSGYSYLQLATMIGYLYENYGKAKFRQFMRKNPYTVQQHKDVLAKIYGLSLSEWEKKWKKWVMSFPSQKITKEDISVIQNQISNIIQQPRKNINRWIEKQKWLTQEYVNSSLSNYQLKYVIKKESVYGNIYYCGLGDQNKLKLFLLLWQKEDDPSQYEYIFKLPVQKFVANEKKEFDYWK